MFPGLVGGFPEVILGSFPLSSETSRLSTPHAMGDERGMMQQKRLEPLSLRGERCARWQQGQQPLDTYLESQKPHKSLCYTFQHPPHLQGSEALWILMLFFKIWVYIKAIFSSLDFNSMSTPSMSNNIPGWVCVGRWFLSRRHSSCP